MNTHQSNICTLLACQITVPSVRNADEKHQHIQCMVEKISRHLNQRPATVVVLPELCTIEYAREAFDNLEALAETLDGPSVAAMRALAVHHRVAVVFGMPRCSDGAYFISQVALSAAGEVLACYDKLHVCQYGASMEKDYFQRGQHLSVFSVAGFRFAPIICYDIRIPELSRTLTREHNVDCLLHCGAYYRDESFASWHAFSTTRAMENQLYLLSLNRAGEHYGDSIACLPWMDAEQPAVHFAPHAEDFRYIDIERGKIECARRDYTFLQDTLADYRMLELELCSVTRSGN